MEAQIMQKQVNVYNRLMNALACGSRSGRKILAGSALFTNPMTEEYRIAAACLPNTHKLLMNFSEMSIPGDFMMLRRIGGITAFSSPDCNVEMSVLEQASDGGWTRRLIEAEPIPVIPKAGVTEVITLHLSEMEKTLKEEMAAGGWTPGALKKAKIKFAEAGIASVIAGLSFSWLLNARTIAQGAGALLVFAVAGAAALREAGRFFASSAETNAARALRDFESFVHELKAGAEKFLAGKSSGAFHDCF